MSQPIVQYAYRHGSPETHSCITLRNSEVARPFQIDSRWTQIRVAFQYIFTTGSAFQGLAGSPKLTFGLLSGSALYTDPSCGHFVGFQSICTTWNTYSGSNNQMGLYSSPWKNILKYMGTETNPGNNIFSGMNIYHCMEHTIIPLHSTLIYWDVLRPLSKNGTYTFITWGNNTSNNSASCAYTDSDILKEIMSITPSTSGPFTTFSQIYSNYTMTINERDSGSFDHVYMGWDREYPNPEVKILNIAIAIMT